jgi:hypothetical protein
MRISEINALKAMGYDERFIRSCVKSVKGQIFAVPASGGLLQAFQLPGTSKILLGFRIQNSNAASVRFSVLMNQERIYDSVEVLMLDVSTASIREEYIETFRHLKGQDVINVEFSNAAGATEINLIAFYLLTKTQ